MSDHVGVSGKWDCPQRRSEPRPDTAPASWRYRRERMFFCDGHTLSLFTNSNGLSVLASFRSNEKKWIQNVRSVGSEATAQRKGYNQLLRGDNHSIVKIEHKYPKMKVKYKQLPFLCVPCCSRATVRGSKASRAAPKGTKIK